MEVQATDIITTSSGGSLMALDGVDLGDSKSAVLTQASVFPNENIEKFLSYNAYFTCSFRFNAPATRAQIQARIPIQAKMLI